MSGEPYITPRTLPSRVRRWKRILRAYERHPYRIAPRSTALLVVDVQPYFTEPSSHAYLPAVEAILPRIAGLVASFRRHGCLVIFTRHAHRPGEEGILLTWWKDTIREGDALGELDGRLDPAGATVLRKTRYSAFARTGLEALLKRRRVRTVSIAGVMTHLCCETTARDAFVRDLQPVFLMDATATEDEALHLSSLRTLADGFAEVMTCRELEGRLGWRKK